MPEPVFYIRGMPPSGPVPEGMLDDFKALLSVPEDSLDRIAEALAGAEGFLDPKSVSSLLRETLAEDPSIDSVRRIILNLEADDIGEVLKFVRRVLDDKPDEFPLGQEDIGHLEALLPRLLKPAPALRRYRKAERLAKITGLPLEDIQLICDLRPVFDDAREEIEALMPYTRLKIVATGGDGLPRTFEAELSAQQVDDLREKAEKATKKLAQLRDKAQECATHGMPDLPLTRAT